LALSRTSARPRFVQGDTVEEQKPDILVYKHGFLGGNGTLATKKMTIEQAKVWAWDNPKCVGFSFQRDQDVVGASGVTFEDRSKRASEIVSIYFMDARAHSLNCQVGKREFTAHSLNWASFVKDSSARIGMAQQELLAVKIKDLEEQIKTSKEAGGSADAKTEHDRMQREIQKLWKRRNVQLSENEKLRAVLGTQEQEKKKLENEVQANQDQKTKLEEDLKFKEEELREKEKQAEEAGKKAKGT
jgi:hypothetical protein